MKWTRLYTESDNKSETIPIEVTNREVKLIQNYMNHHKPLNDPSNKECLETVIRILNDIVTGSQFQNLDIIISNYLFENFGIEMEIDPYGENTGIELTNGGLIEMKDNQNNEFNEDGIYSDLIEGGIWDKDGHLSNGFISVEYLNELLQKQEIGNGVKSIRLKNNGDMAKVLIDM